MDGILSGGGSSIVLARSFAIIFGLEFLKGYVAEAASGLAGSNSATAARAIILMLELWALKSDLISFPPMSALSR